MKMNSLAVGMVAGVLSISAVPVLTSTSVMAAQLDKCQLSNTCYKFQIEKDCDTSGTDWDGTSETCQKYKCFTLEEKFVFKKSTIGTSIINKKSAFSDAETCEWWLTEDKERKPTGIYLPTKACVRVHARSTSGMLHIGHRGYATCKLYGEYITLTEWNKQLKKRLE